MTISSNSALLDALRQYRLLESAQLEEAARLQSAYHEPKGLAGELMRKGWLTAYQANQLLQGRGQDLLLGSYVLMEKLGEGGMGAVFKAMDWKLGRIVAVKLIRKERLESEDAVRRFHREIRAAAALEHPNIVHALDPDQVGGAHLLVMECIEGATDLAKLVKKNGPLPVAQACEYIRQAALGLQHAHERGMVHRDIKPANLLLTADGKTTKILDMGLARLDQAEPDDEKISTMTQEGAVMGTPDYIAPEQALESHTVDIRADLYSLGCTFYYLLTGRAPFTGSLLQKLDKHRYAEPPRIESTYSEVPPGIAAIVQKLMAKKPEDRYQTPAEVAAALALPASADNGLSMAATVPSGPQAATALREASSSEPSTNTLDSPLVSPSADTAKAMDSLHRRGWQMRGNGFLPYAMAGGFFVLIGAVVLLILFLKGPAREKRSVAGETPAIVDNAPARATDDNAWLRQVAALPAKEQIDAVAAKLQELNQGFDGRVGHKIEDGVVTELRFLTDKVTDISPVRALIELKSLACNGSLKGAGQLADLSPLKGMKLTWLSFEKTQVSDLTPLKDMKLTSLNCFHAPVSDLTPLKNVKLTFLNCGGTRVTDLSPLKGMKLESLRVWGTQVSDLSPLKDAKLMYLSCKNTQVTDLSVLKQMPLKELRCDFKPERDAEILRSIKTLEKINGKPAKEFWAEVDAKKPEKKP
jgi:serine/threonine protein kinase